MEPLMIFRHSSPTKLDTANFGTLCKVIPRDYYIQLSQDQENPNWEKLEAVFNDEEAISRRYSFLNINN